MKKTILVCLTLIAATMNATIAFADEKSDALLDALAAKVAKWGDYRVDFSVRIDDQSLAGSFEVSGEGYLVDTPDIVVYCDGTTKWEVNLLLQEVVIDSVDPLDRTILANPARLFDFLGRDYTHRYVGTALVGGVNCDRIEIKETARGTIGALGTNGVLNKNGGNGEFGTNGVLNKNGGNGTLGTNGGASDGQKIDVYISASNGLPTRLDYRMSMLDTDATIDIARITPDIEIDRAKFSFDPRRYEGFEIIDFR